MTDERRQSTRIERRITVFFEVQGKKYRGVILNLSECGLYLQTDQKFPEGTEISLPNPLGGPEVNILKGKIVWEKGLSSFFRPSKMRSGMGVALEAAPLSYIQAIRRLKDQTYPPEKPRPEERFELYHRVSFTSEEEFLTEYTENLSRGGMYVATEKQLEPGTVIKASIDLPGLNEPVQVEGKIAYCLEGGNAEENGRNRGVGVQFMNLTLEARSRLNQYISRLEIHRCTPERRRVDSLPAFGTLTEYLVPEILIALTEEQNTGVLHLESRGVTKRVYVHKGKPIHVDSSLRSERLGHYLSYRGVLALEKIGQWLPFIDLDDIEFSKKMIHMDMFDPSTTLSLVVDCIEERLISTFSWFEGNFVFSKDTSWRKKVKAVPVETYRVVFRGIERWYSRLVLSSWMGITENSLLKKRERRELNVFFPKVAREAWEALETPVSLKQLAEKMSLPIDDILPIAYGLIVSGWVSFVFPTEEAKEVREDDAVKASIPLSVPLKKVPVKKPSSVNVGERLKQQIEGDFERLKRFDLFEMLGVTSTATPDEVKVAYEACKKRYRPEEIDAISDDVLKKKADQVLSWIEVAHNTLCDTDFRDAYRSQQQETNLLQGKETAWDVEQALAMVLVEVDRGEVEEVVRILGQLRKEHPENSILAGYYAWAIFEMNPLENMKSSGNMLDVAIDRDPSDSQLVYFRGKIFERQNQWKSARVYFEKALKLQPEFEKARQALVLVKEKEEDQLRMGQELGLLDS